MEEIKDNAYIRTKQGTIVRIKDTEFDICFNLAGQVLYKNWICGKCFYEEIVEHSKNIIDLIEVGDYVNGKLIHKIDKRPNYCYLYYGNCKTFVDYQIKNIVTKERFARESYKVEEGQDV